MIRDLGTSIGIRSAIGVGSSSDPSSELRLLQQNMPHILCGTPQKLHSLFTAKSGAISGTEVRFVVLDEVDQLIARNLHDFVLNIVKLLPPPKSRVPSGGVNGGLGAPGDRSTTPQPPPPGIPPPSGGGDSPGPLNGRRPSGLPVDSSTPTSSSAPISVERQTALFSNTVPQDVLNLATSIQLREPVRVLVRRDGNVQATGGVGNPSETSQNSRGLRQFYLYLPFTAGSATSRADSITSSSSGHGIIGSGRGGSGNAESVQAREWKLDALMDLFEDVDASVAGNGVGNVVVHVGGMNSLDSVVYKLASRGVEVVPLVGSEHPFPRARIADFAVVAW
jgi:translation initiation factor 4A